jgi:hypothetical protein
MNDLRGNFASRLASRVGVLGLALAALASTGCGASAQPGTLAYCSVGLLGSWSPTGKTDEPSSLEAGLGVGYGPDGGPIDTSQDTLGMSFILLFNGTAELSPEGAITKGESLAGGPPFTFTGTFDLQTCVATGAYASADGTETGTWGIAPYPAL